MRDVQGGAGQGSAAAEASAVRLEGVGLSLGGTEVLKGIDLELPRGQVLALLGPSGCGKTTVLRLVAGLLAPGRGRVFVHSRLAAEGGGRCLPPEERALGMVFQDYALWPHMTVAGNVGFPLEMQRVPVALRRERVGAALARVGLAKFAERRPAELSGGQQQRVAIARAIVGEPGIVLFDEPLSNLDRELRETMVEEIAGLVAELGLTALYVTHDQSEAFSLADKVAVMRGGLIEQIAAPEVLVDRPASVAVADFLRLGAVLPVEGGADGWRLKGGPIIAPLRAAAKAEQVLIPSRGLGLCAPGEGWLDASVVRTLFRGDGHLATLQLDGGHRLQATVPERLHPGTKLGLRLADDALRWFSSQSDRGV